MKKNKYHWFHSIMGKNSWSLKIAKTIKWEEKYRKSGSKKCVCEEIKKQQLKTALFKSGNGSNFILFPHLL